MLLTAALGAAAVGLVTVGQPAVAAQKTIKQCSDEWAADRDAIRASGKTKRVFVAECRGVPLAAAQPRPVTLGKGQYATEAEAKASCPSDAVVWANLRSKVYHASGTRYFGTTSQGAYMCEQESVTAGFHPPRPRGNVTGNAGGGAAPGGAVDGAKDGKDGAT
jgi:hypothetical protein